MFLQPSSHAPAIVVGQSDRVLSHRELAESVQELSAQLQGGLTFLFADSTFASIRGYLACLQAGSPVALLDAGLDPAFAGRLVDLYRPSIIMGSPEATEPFVAGAAHLAPNVWIVAETLREYHPDLAVLLTTSGSTGSPKFVRLSKRNLATNTAAIIDSLGIESHDRTITTLPLHYSFGMSVVNTFLAAGASLITTEHSVIDPGFWELVRTHQPTSLSGVPLTFGMLKRLDLDELGGDSIRVLTQAGGKLDTATARHFCDLMSRRNGRFYVMYGQTEAAPRMTCLPSDRLPEKLGSAGLPLTDGVVRIVDEAERELPPGSQGHIVYYGPNVMMGYAEHPDDLHLGDMQGDRLDTGDLGFVDEEGFLFVTGRIKRIAKVYGLRISLDEIEELLRPEGPTAVVSGDNDTVVGFCEWGDADSLNQVRTRVAAKLRLPVRALNLRWVESLPTLASGKTDYRQLERSLGGAG